MCEVLAMFRKDLRYFLFLPSHGDSGAFHARNISNRLHWAPHWAHSLPKVLLRLLQIE
jgi:hypothetical protein